SPRIEATIYASAGKLPFNIRGQRLVLGAAIERGLLPGHTRRAAGTNTCNLGQRCSLIKIWLVGSAVLGLDDVEDRLQLSNEFRNLFKVGSLDGTAAILFSQQ